MFQNSFQNGNYFELYDPKIPLQKVKNLYKISNIVGNNKVFDKDLKTYVLQFSSSTSKLSFPKQDKKDLYLIQQYLVFQIYFHPGQSWSMQLVISDLNRTKRRIMISPNNNKLEIKPFFVKSPGVNFKEGCWNNFVVDLYSFMEAFKGQTYRCLDNITIMGHYKLRRIYTTNSLPHSDQSNPIQSSNSISLLPKNFYFPAQVDQTTQLNKYQCQNFSQLNLYQPTQPSTKNNSSYLKSTKNRLSTPKTETVKSEKIVQIGGGGNKMGEKQFLANTNGPEIINRLRKREKYVESSDSQVTENVKTPQSTEKNDVKSKKKLVKTQVLPPKVRSSVEKRQKSKFQQKQKQKQKIKSKLNPWRTNAKRSQTSKLPINNESDNNSSPNTTLFKQKKGSQQKQDRKSQHYSESQYIQLSQKFSTLTQNKFFPRLPPSTSQIHPQPHQNDQIQENIQMQTNSIYSNSNRKADEMFSPKKPEMQEINQSICDSLDRRSPRKDFQAIGRMSYYGFAERMMEDYMQDKARPFSPPMNDREQTEEDQHQQHTFQNDQKQVELVYDPVLNCYYDHKTHTYYQLKNALQK